MNKAKRYSPEVRERAVRLLFEHEKDCRSRWAAAVSIASKIGCAPETLRGWAGRVEIDHGSAGRRDLGGSGPAEGLGEGEQGVEAGKRDS